MTSPCIWCTNMHPVAPKHYLPISARLFLLHGCSKGMPHTLTTSMQQKKVGQIGMRKFPWMSGQMWLSHLGGRFRLFVSIGGTVSSQGVIGSTFAGSFDLEFGTYYWKEQSGSQGDLTWLWGRTFPTSLGITCGTLFRDKPIWRFLKWWHSDIQN